MCDLDCIITGQGSERTRATIESKLGLRVTVQQAREWIDSFLARFAAGALNVSAFMIIDMYMHAVRVWRKATIDRATRDGCVLTCSARKRFFAQLTGSSSAQTTSVTISPLLQQQVCIV